MSRITRRDFTKSATAGAALTATALSASRTYGANDRVRVGFIGLGNRGDQVLDAFLTHKDCEVVAICDIYQPYLDFASKKIGTSPTQYRDYRKLLDHKDLDAVVIETPDHWHALQMIDACKAGKDVYVEKPLSLCVAEGRKMVEAARQHKRVVQVGIQRLSSSLGKEAAEFIRGGGIGKVTVGARVPRAERVAEGDRQPARRATAEGLRLGRLARPGSGQAVQQEPHVLPLPLVLRLLRRAAHQLRRPLPRVDPLVARARMRRWR